MSARRTWRETDVSLHRSSADPNVWVAVFGGTGADIHQLIESAARLRRCQQWALTNAPYYDIDLGDRIRWVRDGGDVLVLEARQLDDKDAVS